MKKLLSLILAAVCVLFVSCAPADKPQSALSVADIPKYGGAPYVTLNGNTPSFSEKQRQSTKSVERYSPLDSLGRCGRAYANIGTDLMPTEKRGSISSVKPTGWVQNEYAFISDGHIYNRCHLIGFQLTGENANERNLITGTRYMNVEGMLQFENRVAEYVTSTHNHVLYRVTPVFDGDNLLASGVEMEAWSVEDNGKGVCFDVFCYNVQPGVIITYANGKNKADGTLSGKITAKSSVKGSKSSALKSKATEETAEYVINKKSGKFHIPSCNGVMTMNPENKEFFEGKRSELIRDGYSPCGLCNP